MPNSTADDVSCKIQKLDQMAKAIGLQGRPGRNGTEWYALQNLNPLLMYMS